MDDWLVFGVALLLPSRQTSKAWRKILSWSKNDYFTDNEPEIDAYTY